MEEKGRSSGRQRGVALMLVLAAIVLLTTMGVEFAYNTNVASHLAKSDYDRLRALALAKSAYSFMLLELKFDKAFRQIVQSQNLGQFLGQNAQLPLCQQFPLSTGLIRAVFVEGNLAGLMGGSASEASGEEAPEPSEEIERQRRGASLGQEKAAQKFLSFEGDFDAECVDESSKINLNAFFGLSKTAEAGSLSPFEQYQQFLFRFLALPRYEELFKAADLRVLDVVVNIGDWIDVDAQVSGMGGVGGGQERMAYDQKEAPYAVRNGKLLTLLEAYLIDGVVDEWFSPLIEQFTVYGDGRINACSASTEIVESLIRRYVDATPSLPPLRLEDPEEMGRLVAAVLKPCASGATSDQLKGEIAQSLAAAIGTVSAGGVGSAPSSPAQPSPGGQPAPATDTGFAAYLATEPRYFTLKLTGQVDDTVVRVRAVMDVKENDPKKWKLMYWRIY